MELLIGAIFVFGFAQILKEELEAKAAKKYEEFKIRSEEYKEKINNAKKELYRELDRVITDSNFTDLCKYHYNCMLLADEAYNESENISQVINDVYLTIKKAKEKKSNLYYKKENLKRNGEYKEAGNISKEMNNIQDFIDELYVRMDKLKKEKQDYISLVKELNVNTRRLKLKIRDSGKRGLEWYNNIQKGRPILLK